MSSHLQAAILFYNQERWSEAERALRATLADEPGNPEAIGFLALTLSHVDRLDEAERIARQALAQAPAEPFVHYAMGHVLGDLKKFKEAESHARQALELDPENPQMYSLMASIDARRSAWKQALKWAEEGLALDSENDACRHLRSLALTQMGRSEQARESIDESLREDPDNPFTHANKGWALLHAAKYKESSEHFREALRLNPNLEWARSGLIEALKARNPIYGVMLRFFLWMSRLSGGARWGVIIGLILAQRALARAMKQGGPAGTAAGIALALLLIFVFLTWTAGPLFNLLLRLHPIGRYALNREESRTAAIVGSFFIGGLVLAALGAFVFKSAPILFLGGVLTTMVLPIAASLSSERGGGRTVLLLLTIGLGGLGVAGALFNPLLLGTYLLGLVGFTWVGSVVSR